MQLGTNSVGLGGKLLLLLDVFRGGINLSGLNYVLSFSFGTFNLSLQVLLKGLGLRSGNNLENHGGESNAQKKGNNGKHHSRESYLHH